MARPSTARLAFVALILGNAMLAFGPWLVRLADVGPVAAGFWRLALGAPMLLLIVAVTRQKVPPQPRIVWAMIGLGGLFFAADLGFWHMGIHHTRLANATLFGNITSFVFPIYGFLLARRGPSGGQAFALGLAAVGVVLLLGRSYELSPQNLYGDLLCIAAGLLYTGYLIAIDRGRASIAPLPLLAASTVAGILPLLGFAWALGETVWPTNWTPLVLLALGSQVIGQGLIVFAIGHQPPLVVGLALLTQPLVAATIGWSVYGERLGPVDLAGALAIAIALVLVRRPPRETVNG